MTKLLITLLILAPCGPVLLARQATQDLPPRVDAGGHLLRLRVEGPGSPAVVMEIGLGGFLEEWAAVQPEVARFTTVVAYDRVGRNYDEAIVTGEEIARELHAALVSAGVRPPYMLVGQSFGGIYQRIFASLYPDEVAGIVLLDPSQEDFIDWMKANYPAKEFSGRHHDDWPEANGIRPTLEQLTHAGPLPNVPVVVVTAARPVDDPRWQEVAPVWKASHERWVKTLPQGRHVLAANSGHGVHVEAPELVVGLIRELVTNARQRSIDSRGQHP